MLRRISSFKIVSGSLRCPSSSSLFSARSFSYEAVSVLGKVSPQRSIPSTTPITFPSYAFTSHVPQTMETFVPLLDPSQQAKMRASCQLAAQMVEFAGRCVHQGRSTDEIDALVHQEILRHGAYPSPLNYHGFPKSICTSVNNVVVHGIPDSRTLQDGDIISIDVSVYYNGFHGDTCKTFLVGNVDAEGRDLVQTTLESLEAAIAICKPGALIKDIGKTIQRFCQPKGYGIVREYTGHGVGEEFHCLPYVMHYVNGEPGEMIPGMAFTIEPMLNEGSAECRVLEDGWTVVTKDGKRSAQFEHTILITEDGADILTLV